MVAEDSESALWVFINSDLVQSVRSFIKLNLELGALSTFTPQHDHVAYWEHCAHQCTVCNIKMSSQ